MKKLKVFAIILIFSCLIQPFLARPVSAATDAASTDFNTASTAPAASNSAADTFGSASNASKNAGEYPRLANYFLKWTIEDDEVADLAKWDVLILDMEVQENSKAQLEKIRELNPNIKIIAYITSEEVIGDIYQNQYSQYANLRKRLVDGIGDSYWLKDSKGNKISFWPGTYMLNMTDGCPVGADGQRWNEYLPQFVYDNIYSIGLWDGVFYDNLWGDIGWIQGGNMDVNNNSQIPSVADMNRAWAAGNIKMLQKSRALMGNDFFILGNGNVYLDYQKYLNGMLFESFPSTWENGGTWSGSMQTYFKLQTLNKQPQYVVINTYNHDRNNFAKMRFGLTSTLLRDSGFFSFDYDNSNHGQLWWYDEYDVNLGKPLYPAYNILDKGNDAIKPGLWRRDYENGIVIVNSTAKAQTYIFSQEEFEKISGTQDRSVNNGAVVNFIKLNPNDGVILLKRQTQILNNSFYNGNYVRVFDPTGHQVRTGFFSYMDNFPGNTQVLLTDLNKDGSQETLSNNGGMIAIFKDGKKIAGITPYGKTKFKGQMSMAVSDLNNKGTNQIITGAGAGGGPQVIVMDKNGKAAANFFAYDKTFKGGVNVAAGNVGGDAVKEIVTAPGAGSQPLIKIFSPAGKLYGQFLAYDKNFKGGVSVAVGDVNGDGQNEIITGAGAGGSPEVRIFDRNGKLLGKFMAYDKTVKTGVKVVTEDINKDGVDEILASVISL